MIREITRRVRRLFPRPAGSLVPLGCLRYGRRVYACLEGQVLVLPPSRTGKSGLIAGRILSHPSAVVLVISTRPDLYQPGESGEPS